MDDEGRGGYAKGRARREQIIEVATRMFGRVGFNGATMRDIAAACGVSRAGLAHHFATKESLLRAVLVARDEEDLQRFRRNGSGNRDGISVLRGMIDLAAYNATMPGLVGLYAVLSAEAGDPAHPAHDYFVARYDRIRRGTARALRRADDRGYLVPGVDVQRTAAELTALMDGLQVQWRLEPAATDMAAVLRCRIQELLTVDVDGRPSATHESPAAQ